MILSNGSILPNQLGSLADVTPLFADASYYPSTYLQMLNSYAAYGQIYRKQLWVAVAVQKLAAGTARMPFDIKRHGDANDATPEPGPLADLMRQPNPQLSGFKLWQWTASTKKVYGEAFWLKVRDDKDRVRELRPMHPANMILRRDDDGNLYWVYTTGVRNVSQLPPIPAEDVVAFTSYNPDNLERGMSKLESLNQTLLNEDASRRATASFWARGARPSVVLSHPQGLSDPAIQRLKASWSAEQAGADNMGGTAVLDEGIVPHIIQLNSLEMQYIESRKLNREEVAAAFDVPQNAIGILDRATFSNVTEMMRSLYRETLAPDFVEYESVVNHQLVPDFDKTGEVFTRFNMDEVLRGDFETRATAVGSLLERGVLTPNEARPFFGFAPFNDPGADKLYANAAMVPLGSPAERISITSAVSPTAAQSGEVAEVEGTGSQAAAASPIKALVAAEVRKALASLAPKALGPVVVEADAAAPKLTVRAIRSRVNMKATAAEQRKALIAEHQTALDGFFKKQGASVAASVADGETPQLSDWDGDLGELLSTLGTATAQQVGAKVAKSLGGSYSLEQLSDWLSTNTGQAASAINAATAAQIQDAIANAEDGTDAEDDAGEPATPHSAVTDLFAGLVAARAAQIAVTRYAQVAGYATVDAGKQHSASTKTWNTGANPRSAHADMDGETVGLDETFSDGSDYPGSNPDPDLSAGCNCTVSINREDQ